ncbi:MAG TPA: glutamate--tRNA ligase [Aggregatilineaceae bacterium]|nr:glutamate--tRNA ligase [Aggregatilineaceae bacterium]
MTEKWDSPVRVRFAPSPTGPMHIGGVRTALFNWFFARHNHGAFILRVEDTDQRRYDPAALRLITDGLRWLGIDWDEGPEVGGEYGPYIQTERLDLYREWAGWLVEHDQAYRCYCTEERLARLREQQHANHDPYPGYDRRCRFLTPEERERLHAETGGQFVIRFKMPIGGTTTVHDLLRGDITVDNRQLQDLVLLKSDGYPTYHLANVVDDHFMQISHILRAEEWIPSAPVHRHLYQAFGWDMPYIAHLPVILNPSGHGKLSKRSAAFTEGGRKVPVLLYEFQEAGYVPEAIVNFLTNVGWSFGDDREVFTVDETIERFDLSRVNPAGSAFPIEKLDWLNGVYIREMDTDRLAALLKPVLETAGYTVDLELVRKVIPLIRVRIKTLNDAIPMAGFFFADTFTPPPPEELIQQGMDATQTRAALEAALATLEALPDFNAATQEEAMRSLAERLGLKPGQLFGALRMATTGQRVSPPLFESMEVLGRETSLERIRLAIASL